jgi:hypothetical protein
MSGHLRHEVLISAMTSTKTFKWRENASKLLEDFIPNIEKLPKHNKNELK